MRRNKKNLIYSILLLILLSIGIGYAYLTSNLSISGNTEISANSWDIHFANIVVDPNSVAIGTNNQAATIDSSDTTKITYAVRLNRPGDYYEFNVDIVNAGTIDGMISSIESKINNQDISDLPSYLRYSIRYVEDLEILPNHILNANTTETIKVRIEYNDNIAASDLPDTLQSLNMSLSIDFVQKDENGIERVLPIIKPVQYALNEYDVFESTDTSAFRSNTYLSKIKTVNLSDSINPPENVIDSWDISVRDSGDVMAYITANSTDNTKYDLYIQGNGALIANPDSSFLFTDMYSLDEINNIEVLDTSRVNKMIGMFSFTASDSETFTLNLGSNFDTSNVTDMSFMFRYAGGSSPNFTLDLGDNFDTSKVTNMSSMFNDVGNSSTVFTLDLGDKFDTSNVTNMSFMFRKVGASNPNFTLDLGDKFDTSNVTDMGDMFSYVGENGSNLIIDFGDKFDTSKVTNMEYMFYNTGVETSNFHLAFDDKFDTSNVTNMEGMFENTAANNSSFTLDLGDNFDTSKVTNMYGTFYYMGRASTVITLDLGDKFDTSNVTTMYRLFSSVGYSNPNFTLDLGNKFDTSNVSYMYGMFEYTGYNSTVFTLDLGDKFNTDNVTNISKMFYRTGNSNSNFELDLSTFNFSSITTYEDVFNNFKTTNKIFVKDLNSQNWVITNGGNSNLTTANVLIKT